MTSLIEYGNKGRRLIFLHATYNALDKWTDEDINWDDAIAAGYITTSSIALFIPDPVTTILAYTDTKLNVRAGWWLSAMIGREILETGGFYEQNQVTPEKLNRMSIENANLVRAAGMWIKDSLHTLSKVKDRRRFPSHGV